MISDSVDNELEYVSHQTMVMVIRQMSSLLRQAETMFSDLETQSRTMDTRVTRIKTRVNTLQQSVNNLDSLTEKVGMSMSRLFLCLSDKLISQMLLMPAEK